VQLRQQPPWAAVLAYVEPGLDEFPGEKTAMEIEERLLAAVEGAELPLAGDCRGVSPAPREYRDIAPDVAAAVFDTNRSDIAAGWREWRRSLGTIRRARFYSMPGGFVRYEIGSEKPGRLEHRIGSWKQTWTDGRLAHFEPVEEIVTHSEKPWFRDVTGAVFAGVSSFHEQLARGTGYWRARLDPACGIDVYGENGIAVGDIDGDGQDEIYVCQPGGLPNRLYRNDGSGRFRDISHEAGLDILDNTTSALFADLRNSGCQDVVVVRDTQPMLFLNEGHGRFRHVPDAFRFASEPRGSFTSIAAADYDRDGRLDIYLCCYVYFQNEAQYSYPVPYHDARNGPPNFLFRNRLDQEPGYFEDVTEPSGMNHNNNRFSFSAAWCDYNNDGWPDLYVVNDFGRKNLYRNTNGHFRDVAEEAGADDVGPGMSGAWLDYDGDGRPDLLISNMWTPCGQRVTSDPAFPPVAKDPSLREAYRRHVKGNSLYHNNGDGTFTYTGDAQGVEMGHWSWSCDGSDIDNDGVPEIYIACGMLTNNGASDLMSFFYRQVVAKSPVRFQPAPAYEIGWNAINQLIRQDYSWSGREPNVVYARRGDRFYDFSGVSGIDKAEDSRAFAFTDIDGDGNLDLILRSRMGPQVRVFQNNCGISRNVLVLSLRGTRSNRDGIGARVEVDGQVKWLGTGSGYLSQHTKRLHFGLGAREHAEKIRVYWPSGEMQELPSLAADYVYEVTEGAAEYRSKRLHSHAEYPDTVSFTADNQSRFFTAWLREPVPLPEERRGPALLVLHAGEPLPRLPVPLQALDLRRAPPDLAAAYAIVRRYLFDYRADLETPFWLLLDTQGRIRKVYAEAPDAATAQDDLRSADGPVPDRRGLPFPGAWFGQSARDYYKFGGALLQAGYPEQALPYLEEMLRRTPDNAKALLAVGRIHLQAKRLPQAREALRRALLLDPALPEAWNELGGVETADGNLQDALRNYEKALAIGPDLPWALQNAAQTQDQLGNTQEAERLYRRILAIDSKNGEAANGLGLLLAKQGHNDEARKLFEQAISIRRNDSSAINNLGVLYINMGQMNDAIAAFEYGIRMSPDADILYLNLARIRVRMGEQDKARDLMRELLARKPGDSVARNALKELEAQ
jgi:tetratricopeptide (TPR) repeat protein